MASLFPKAFGREGMRVRPGAYWYSVQECDATMLTNDSMMVTKIFLMNLNSLMVNDKMVHR